MRAASPTLSGPGRRPEVEAQLAWLSLLLRALPQAPFQGECCAYTLWSLMTVMSSERAAWQLLSSGPHCG